MPIAPSEQDLWARPPKEKPARVTDAEINERYARGEGRIVIETNREKLPGFVASLKQANYMDLRPFYQRRPRWSAEKQSLLIESFIMNIPVPPVSDKAGYQLQPEALLRAEQNLRMRELQRLFS